MYDPERLNEFVAMWRWLSAHPVNDRDYYMKHVLKGGGRWINECPLSDREGETCTGCKALWRSKGGTLCSDGASPLRAWQGASIDQPDLRIFYASMVGTLGMQARKCLQAKEEILALT